VVAAFVSAVAVLAVVPRAASLVTETRRRSGPSACATRPRPVTPILVPSDVRAWAHDAPVLGRGRIWALESAVDVPAEFQRGVWGLKFPWYLHPADGGIPVLSARRLDGPGRLQGQANGQ
jgi:hypothetical protein